MIETPKNKPAEPTKTVELKPEPGVECVVEVEKNQCKQLNMILLLPNLI
jgi:hypothetical protein